MALVDFATIAAVVGVVGGIVGITSGIVTLYFNYGRRSREQPLLELRPVDMYYTYSPAQVPDEIDLNISADFWIDNAGDRDTTISAIVGTIGAGDKSPRKGIPDFVVLHPVPATISDASSSGVPVPANNTSRLRFTLKYSGIPPLQKIRSVEWDFPFPWSNAHTPNIEVGLKIRHTHGVFERKYYISEKDSLTHLTQKMARNVDR